MDERDIKDIYSIFIGFTIVILFYGTSYNTIIQIMNILATTNMLITSTNIPSIHIPLYSKVAIAILLIPMIINIYYDMINIPKIAKTQDERLGEIIKAFIRISFILVTISVLASS